MIEGCLMGYVVLSTKVSFSVKKKALEKALIFIS